MLLGMFELVGILFHTCRPWPDVISAYNGTVMKQIIDGRLSNCMISFEAAVWAKAGVVWAGFTIVDSFVSSTTCRIAAHNTFQLLVLAQEVDRSVTQDPQHLDATSSWDGQFGDVGEQK